ncbi:MAG: relaxase/mobilization nuclease domain-containing protein [Clostridia bacterium]
MAIVSFTNYKKSQTKGMMINVIKYCIQDKKTMANDINFVSGVNCTAKSVVDDFMNTKLMYHKSDGKMFFHLVQAFEKDEDIKPETAHEMAIKLAEYFKDYEVLVSTHFDRDYTHSHLIINSVNFETGKKFHFLEKDLIPLRKFNDELCKEYGCKICEPKPKELRLKGMKSSEYHSALKGKSWKFKLINTIDDCMRFSKSKEQFKKLMQSEGYQVKWEENRKSITYNYPNGMKCRDNKLHQERYLKIRMEREFELRQQRIEQIERITQAEQLQMDGEEYRLYIRQSAADSGYTEQFTRENTVDKLQCETTRKPTPILSGAERAQTNAPNPTTETRTGWEVEREELFQLENSDRDNSTELHNADRSNNFSTNQTPTRTLTNSLMWSIKRLEQAENEDDEMAEILGMVEITALTITGVYLLIAWLKSQNGNDINDEDVENYIETIKQEQENEIDYTARNDMKMGGF